MLHKIIEFSVRNKLIVALFVLGLIGYGSYQVTQLSVDAVPDITDNQVQIITVAPALGATDIERLVTFPIEQANSNIAGIKHIRSFSRFGLSLVTIVFDDEVDVYWARQQVNERLNQVKEDIPDGVGMPELGPISTGLGEIYQYVVRPKKGYESKYDITELRTIQDWVVRQQLLSVKGVAEVSSFGGNLKQIEVAVKPERLNAHGVTITDLFAALEQNNDNTGGAYIEKGATTLYIRSEGLVKSLEEIEHIPVKSNKNGLPLQLRDVADVKIGHAIRYGAMTYNGEQEVSGAVVMMLKGENSNKIIANVKSRIEEIQKTLPEGVVIEAFLDRTKMVNQSISTVETNLAEGALIVLFVLVFFLGNLRAGFLVASVIPLSMLFAICMMNFFGVSGNLMSLGALDFGLIVDGAVIIVETILHHLTSKKLFGQSTRLKQKQMDEEVVESSSKMMNSAVFGQIIILIVYLPIFSLQGIEGKMFIPMAQTVAFALLGAFILSLTYIPMMSSLVLDKRLKTKKNSSDRIMHHVEKIYLKCLNPVLRHGKITIALILILFTTSLFVASRLGGEFIPSLEEGDFAVETRVLNGSSLTTTVEFTNKAAKILKDEFPEVEKVVTKIGSGEVPTDPMPMDAGDMLVILKDKSEWTSAKTFNELAEKMTKAVSVVPGITTSFQYPVQMRFNELMTGVKQDVSVKIFGEDLDQLSQLAEKIGTIVKTVDGAEELYIEPVTGMPQVVIDYNRGQIAKYGLSVAEINRVVNMAFAGQSAGMFYEGEKRFDMVVRLDQEKKANLEDIQQLLIATPSGQQIPLKELATVNVVMGPNQIQREEGKRRIIVGFNVKNKDIQTVVEELQQKVDAQFELPAGYFIRYGGSYENLKQAKERLAIVVPISLASIFVLLFFAFRSFKESLLIYTAIPLSAIGGILLLASRGLPFSISAGVGFIALFGIAVLNGIVLLAEFNRIKKSGIKDPLRIIIQGTTTRLRPVLMTAFVASFGFIPMALSNGAGAEVQRPLATVVIGGLMSATFLTLFMLPLLFYVMEKRTQNKQKNKTNAPIKLVVTIGLLFGLCGQLQAQTPIAFTDALQLAQEKNLTLQYRQVKVEQAKLNETTSVSIAPLSITAGFGELNGPYSDTSFGIGQNFQFPTVYKRLKNVLQKQTIIHEWELKNEKRVISRDLELIFAQAYSVEQQKEVLTYIDSIYSQALMRQRNRLKAGDINAIELSVFENQRFGILQQTQQMTLDQQELALQLNRLLATKGYFPLVTQPVVEQHLAEIETNHPLLNQLTAEVEANDARVVAERSRLLPEFTLEYNNNSFRGNGPDDQFYQGKDRFHSVQVGVSIPLFTKNVRQSIEVMKIESILGKQAYAIQKQQMMLEVDRYEAEINHYNGLLTYYEKLTKPDQVLTRIDAQFAQGEINYIEFVTLVNQTVENQMNYLRIQQARTLAIINQQYYTNL